MDSTCLIVDWILTVFFTVVALVFYAIPRKRAHPLISGFLEFLFLCYVFQFFFLEYAASVLEQTGHPEYVTLSIPAMALLAIGVLWILWPVAEFILSVVVVLVIAQTTNVTISMPIAALVGFIVWLLLEFSAVANIKHIFAVAIFASADVVIGIASMLLVTSTAVNGLPVECQLHFNMFLSCDANCGSLVVYGGAASRVSWVVAFIVLFALRMALVAAFTTTCTDAPDLVPAFFCCDMVNRNNDRLFTKKDRRAPVRSILAAVDVDELDNDP